MKNRTPYSTIDDLQSLVLETLGKVAADEIPLNKSNQLFRGVSTAAALVRIQLSGSYKGVASNPSLRPVTAIEHGKQDIPTPAP